MNDQDGKTPLEWIVTIAVLTVIIGVSIAMIFGNTSEVLNILKQF